MSFANVIKRTASGTNTTVYKYFRGVDFSVDPSLVQDSRSPYAPNLISDTGGMPEKRLGWRTIAQCTGRINGIFFVELEEEKHMVIHGGGNIYTYESGELVIKKENVNDGRSTAFFMYDGVKGGLYILTGGDILVFDGEEIKDVTQDAYVPNVLAACDPSGGGELIEPVNLLSKKRMQSFIGTRSDLIYQLSATDIESVDKVEVLNTSGTKTTLTTAEYSVDLAKGTVNFHRVYERIIAGQDNIFITFSKDTEGYKDRITNCTIGAVYGLNKSDKMFLSGNKEHNGKIWHSFSGKPSYFPDTYYVVAGSEENRVMGFSRLGRHLLIIKDDNQQDSTIFQLWGERGSNATVNYYIEQGIAGVGAVSATSFDTLLDEPLFLSRRGVMAIYSNTISLERTIKNRSYFIDPILTKEESLENAVATEWNGYYLIAINGRCYVLDSRNKAYRHNQTDTTGDYIYECYHWDNFPAICFFSRGGELFFGTEEGKVCKMNTDIISNSRFNDDDEAVVAAWSTKNDDDSKGFLYKTMSKRGCSVTIKPYVRSSCTVYYKKDGDVENFVKHHLMDIFNWDNMDFERFTFNTNESPQDVYLRKKVKKYKRLQLIIRNAEKDEGFGILQITKSFVLGGYAKK